MRKNEEIGAKIYRIGQRMTRIHMRNQTDAGLDQDTIMYGWIILQIANHEDEGVYQKSVEKRTGLNKSTISTILSNLEKKGYIIRCSVEEDARLKRLFLTEKGKETYHNFYDALQRSDVLFSQGLTEEDQNTLIGLLQKIENNLTEMEGKMNL